MEKKKRHRNMCKRYMQGRTERIAGKHREDIRRGKKGEEWVDNIEKERLKITEG